jgi:hypothetical protein
MLRLPLAPAAALAVAAATLACAQDGPRHAVAAPLEHIAWSYRAANGPHAGATIRLSHDGIDGTLDRSDLPEAMDRVTAALDTPGRELSFELVREAGRLACTGQVERQRRASGTCRFVPDAGFVQGLAAHDLTVGDSRQLLGLALVDAHLAWVDGLAKQGFRVTDLGGLISVAALDASPTFAAELADAGLTGHDLEDLIAARAVGVDGAWARGMAEAGYRDLQFDRAIQLRALDVTPDYARRMARVARATDGAE